MASGLKTAINHSKVHHQQPLRINTTTSTQVQWFQEKDHYSDELECGPMPNLMVALSNTGGALCSTPQSLADAHY